MFLSLTQASWIVGWAGCCDTANKTGLSRWSVMFLSLTQASWIAGWAGCCDTANKTILPGLLCPAEPLLLRMRHRC